MQFQSFCLLTTKCDFLFCSSLTYKLHSTKYKISKIWWCSVFSDVVTVNPDISIPTPGSSDITAIPGGPGLIPSQLTDVFGNDVILRGSYIATGGRKAWISKQHPLPQGILQEFYFYVHNNTGVDSAWPIRLQIWRPTEEPTAYQLMYDKEVTVDRTSLTGVYYEVSVSTFG